MHTAPLATHSKIRTIRKIRPMQQILHTTADSYKTKVYSTFKAYECDKIRLEGS